MQGYWCRTEYLWNDYRHAAPSGKGIRNKMIGGMITAVLKVSGLDTELTMIQIHIHVMVIC